MVQKGKFSAGTAELVMALKKVDFLFVFVLFFVGYCCNRSQLTVKCFYGFGTSGLVGSVGWGEILLPNVGETDNTNLQVVAWATQEDLFFSGGLLWWHGDSMGLWSEGEGGGEREKTVLSAFV